MAQGDQLRRFGEGLVISLEIEMLDRANSGPEPAVEILRAIRHGAAAGACRVAARETRSAYWAGMAEDQRGKARRLLCARQGEASHA